MGGSIKGPEIASMTVKLYKSGNDEILDQEFNAFYKVGEDAKKEAITSLAKAMVQYVKDSGQGSIQKDANGAIILPETVGFDNMVIQEYTEFWNAFEEQAELE